MRPLRLTPIARPRRGLAAVLAGAALLGAAPAPASAHGTIRLRFQKQCMGTICTGTLTTASGRPIAGTTVSASLAAAVVRERRDRILRDGDHHIEPRFVHDESPRRQRPEGRPGRDPRARRRRHRLVEQQAPRRRARVHPRVRCSAVVGPRHRVDRAAPRRQVTAAPLTSARGGRRRSSRSRRDHGIRNRPAAGGREWCLGWAVRGSNPRPPACKSGLARFR